MAELFRFRCFRCQKLLGAPASKFGRTIQCPRCGADLVVPSPEDAPDAGEEAPADEPGLDLNLNLDLGEGLVSTPARRGPSSSLRDPNFADGGANPVAFLESGPLDVPAGSAAGPEPEPEADPEADEPGPAPVIDPAAPGLVVDRTPRVSPVTGRPVAALAASDAAGRRRDVVLPRTVVLAWQLGALLGTGFAFVAGLLVGHYVWTG